MTVKGIHRTWVEALKRQRESMKFSIRLSAFEEI
jgi:hypothetical protein